MSLIRGPRARKVISHLLVALAAGSMLATTQPIDASLTSGLHGRIELTPQNPVARFELRVAASEEAVSNVEGETAHPWSGRIDYALSGSDEAPGIRFQVVPGPRSDAGIPEPVGGETEQYLPPHHDACEEGQPCIRSYEVVFRLTRPRSTHASVRWAASVHLGFPDEELPSGATLTLAAVGVSSRRGGDLPENLAATRLLFSAWLEQAQRRDTPFRINVPSGHSAGPVEVTSSADVPASGIRITLVPEDPSAPMVNVPYGGTTTFNPVGNCSKPRCWVGYVARIRPEEDFISDAVGTHLRFSARHGRIGILPGGVNFESTRAQITRAVRGVARPGTTIPVDVRVVKDDPASRYHLPPTRIPNGTPIEIEGLLETEMIGGGRFDSISAWADEGGLHAKLHHGRRHDRFTFAYVERCRVDHAVPQASPRACYQGLSFDGPEGFEVSAYPENDVKLRWRLTVRLRFPTLRKAPAGIRLLIGEKGR